MMDLWDMLRAAQAAKEERLQAEQRIIDALPRPYRVPPPAACGCFEAHCRGVRIVNGRLPDGLLCKEEFFSRRPATPP